MTGESARSFNMSRDTDTALHHGSNALSALSHTPHLPSVPLVRSAFSHWTWPAPAMPHLPCVKPRCRSSPSHTSPRPPPLSSPSRHLIAPEAPSRNSRYLHDKPGAFTAARRGCSSALPSQRRLPGVVRMHKKVAGRSTSPLDTRGAGRASQEAGQEVHHCVELGERENLLLCLLHCGAQ